MCRKLRAAREGDRLFYIFLEVDHIGVVAQSVAWSVVYDKERYNAPKRETAVSHTAPSGGGYSAIWKDLRVAPTGKRLVT